MSGRSSILIHHFVGGQHMLFLACGISLVVWVFAWFLFCFGNFIFQWASKIVNLGLENTGMKCN
jgi:hypothetical protein